MIYFYIYQAVSLLVSLALLPIYLHFLSLEDYSAWMVFTYSALLAGQMHASIQNIWARRISMNIVEGDDPRATIRACRSDYIILFLLSCSFITGFISLYFIAIQRINYIFPFILFMVSFCYVFIFTHQFVTLLAQARLKIFYLILSTARLTQLVTSLALFMIGANLYSGIAAVAFASFLGILLIQRFNEFPLTRGAIFIKHSQNLASYFIAPLSYSLYFGCFLIFSTYQNDAEIVNFGLFFQCFLLLYAVSIMPSQILVKKMSEYVVSSENMRFIIALQILSSASVYAFGLLAIALSLNMINFLLNSILELDIILKFNIFVILLYSVIFFELIINIMSNYKITLNDTSYYKKINAFYLVTLIISITITVMFENIELTFISILLLQTLKILSFFFKGLKLNL